MRILIDVRPLLERNPGGVSIYAAELVRALAARGRHDYVLFSNAGRRPVPAALPEGPRIDRSFHRYPNRLFNAAVAFAGRPLLEEIAGDADLVYLPNLNFCATRRPLVATVHDLSFVRHPEFFSPKQRAWHALVGPGRLLRQAEAVVAVSAHTKADIIEIYGIAEERIFVVPPAVSRDFRPRTDAEVLRVRAAYGLPETFLLYLGAVEPRKNLIGLIAAFEKAGQDGVLAIAGGLGWRGREVVRRASSSPARDRIRFLGYVPQADKPALYGAAAALVYPSFYEGFGMPPLEAMAVGTPVVAGKNTSLGEVVADAGLLVDPRSTGEMAAAMEAVLTDDRLRETLRAKGLARAAAFTWDGSAAALEDVFAYVDKAAPRR